MTHIKPEGAERFSAPARPNAPLRAPGASAETPLSNRSRWTAAGPT